MQSLPVRLTHHAQKRLAKRFGIRGEDAAQRAAEDIVRNGTLVPTRSECITILRRGHSFVFAKTVDYNDTPILLMITACNDDKSSEWKTFHHGKVQKAKTVKQSKRQRSLSR
ncbi:MAG: hypothetical protein PHO27_02400 [Sulfuricurvum sp.]|nr:hypothetical protein [Sulfuricurvum sp.]